MSKFSKLVANRLAISRHLLCAIEIHAATVADEIAATLPDFDTDAVLKLLGALRRAVELSIEMLEERELAYTAEKSDDPEQREIRDQAISTARSMIRAVRSRVGDLAGTAGSQRYGLVAEIPRKGPDQAAYLLNVISLLDKNPAEFDDPIGPDLHTEALSFALKTVYRPLTNALGAVERESRELQLALIERDKAVHGWTDTYQGVASTLAGLFRLAGQGPLADRIRPTARRMQGEENESGLESVSDDVLLDRSDPNPGDD